MNLRVIEVESEYMLCRNLACELATNSSQAASVGRDCGFTSVVPLSEYRLDNAKDLSLSAQKIAEKLWEVLMLVTLT